MTATATVCIIVCISLHISCTIIAPCVGFMGMLLKKAPFGGGFDWLARCQGIVTHEV